MKWQKNNSLLSQCRAGGSKTERNNEVSEKKFHERIFQFTTVLKLTRHDLEMLLWEIMLDPLLQNANN